jgi:Tol biopolymer transport system component
MRSAQWSPDGRYIVAVRLAQEKHPQLVLFDTAEQSWAELGDGAFPQWSPDGRYIVAVRLLEKEKPRQLVLFDRPARTWAELGEGRFPRWSRDGDYIYYSYGEDGINRIRIEDRRVEEVVGSAVEVVEELSLEPVWWTLDPEGRLLTLRSLDTSEIYALDFKARCVGAFGKCFSHRQSTG